MGNLEWNSIKGRYEYRGQAIHWDYKDNCVIFYIDGIPIIEAGIGEILCSMTKNEIETHMKEFLTSPWLTNWHKIAKKYYDEQLPS